MNILLRFSDMSKLTMYNWAFVITWTTAMPSEWIIAPITYLSMKSMLYSDE
jgi:hypothetical protein